MSLFTLCFTSVSNLPPNIRRQARVTITVPDAEPAGLRCQSCDTPLTFIDSIIGGVTPIERWDRYVCRRCGAAFEYRARTRKLKRTA